MLQSSDRQQEERQRRQQQSLQSLRFLQFLRQLSSNLYRSITITNLMQTTIVILILIIIECINKIKKNEKKLLVYHLKQMREHGEFACI